MSKFFKCKDSSFKKEDGKNKDICGVQYLATYGSKVGEKKTKAISQTKYKLTFKYLGNEN